MGDHEEGLRCRYGLQRQGRFDDSVWRLIHISQISNERINKPSDVLEIGQEVQVKITELDTEKKRVSLSIRALLEASDEESAPAEQADSDVVYEAGPSEE